MIRASLVAVAACLVLAACTGKDAVDQNAGGQFRFVSGQQKGQVIQPADRKAAGRVTGTQLDGSAFALNAYTGKVVVVNFFASWCAPCQTELPNFAALAREVQPRGVQFVGVDAKDTSRSAGQAFVTDSNVGFPVVYDEKAKAAAQLGNVPATSLPVTVLLDKQQRIAGVYLGAQLPADLQPALDRLATE